MRRALTDSGVDGAAEEQRSPVRPLWGPGQRPQVLLPFHVDVDQLVDGRRQPVLPVVVVRAAGGLCRRRVDDGVDAVVLVLSQLLVQLLVAVVLGVMKDDGANERVREQDDHQTDVRLDHRVEVTSDARHTTNRRPLLRHRRPSYNPIHQYQTQCGPLRQHLKYHFCITYKSADFRFRLTL